MMSLISTSPDSQHLPAMVTSSLGSSAALLARAGFVDRLIQSHPGLSVIPVNGHIPPDIGDILTAPTV